MILALGQVSQCAFRLKHSSQCCELIYTKVRQIRLLPCLKNTPSLNYNINKFLGQGFSHPSYWACHTGIVANILHRHDIGAVAKIVATNYQLMIFQCQM